MSALDLAQETLVGHDRIGRRRNSAAAGAGASSWWLAHESGAGGHIEISWGRVARGDSGGLSARTIGNQIRLVCRKLGFGDRRELKGRRAAARGYIFARPPEERTQIVPLLPGGNGVSRRETAMYARALLGIIAFGLFTTTALGVAFAAPPAQTPPDAGQSPASQTDSYDLLLAVLNDAYQSETLSDPLSELLAELFIEYLIAPVTGESPGEIEARLSGLEPYELLLAVLAESRDDGTLSDALSDLLSDLFIEYLIAPVTGETPEEAKRRLSDELRPESAAIDLPAGWSGFLRHSSGARIEVPDGATDQAATVQIEEVAPPDEAELELAGKAFDFTVEDDTLDGAVTLRIPYELAEGQDTSRIAAAHWNEETEEWEEVDGIVDETTGTVRVTTSDLSLYTTLYGNPNLGLLSCDRFQSAAECLANRFAPALSMHPQERFLPRSVDGFVSQAGDGSISSDELDDEQYDENFTLDVPDDIQDSTTSPVTVYWTIRANGLTGHVHLQYYIFYYYDYLNPLQRSACARLANPEQYDPSVYGESIPPDTAIRIHGNFCHPHEADWELIQMRFPILPFTDTAERVDEIIEGNVTAAAVTYSQHGWSESNDYDKIQHIGSHPVSYVALGKHANYFGPPSDITEYISAIHDQISAQGRELDPPALSSGGYNLEGITEMTPWVAYEGKWGEEEIDGPDHPIRWDTPLLWDGFTIAGSLSLTGGDLLELDNIFQFTKEDIEETADEQDETEPDPGQDETTPGTAPPDPISGCAIEPTGGAQSRSAGVRIEALCDGVFSVQVGEPAKIPIRITNTGEVSREFPAGVYVYGKGIGDGDARLLERIITLDPGESWTRDVHSPGEKRVPSA